MRSLLVNEILLAVLESNLETELACLEGLNVQAGENPGQLQRCVISGSFNKIDNLELQITKIKEEIKNA